MPDPATLAAQRLARAHAQALADGTAVHGPYLAPCVCGAGKHAHAGPTRKGGFKDNGCVRYRPDAADQLYQRAVEGMSIKFDVLLRDALAAERAAVERKPREPGTWLIYPSDVGACRRKLWYRQFPPEHLDPDFKGEARAGEIIERVYQDLMSEAFPWRQFQVEVRTKGLDRTGRIDTYDPITGNADDTKTLSHRRWEQVEEQGPDRKHLGQIGLYGLTLEEAGEFITSISLTYIARNDFQVMEFTYPWNDTTRAWGEEARAELMGYATTLDLAEATGVLPPRDRSGPSTDELCRRCEFRSTCWEIPKATAAGRSPESWVALGPEDDPEYVAQVAWALREAVRIKKLMSEVDELYDVHKQKLDGVRPGVYEDAMLTKGSAGGTNWKKYHQLTVEAFERGQTDLTRIEIPQNARKAGTAKLVPIKKREPVNRPVPAPDAPAGEVES